MPRLCRFAPEDKHNCLKLFDGNQLPYFAVEERPKFEQFLDKLAPPYFYFVVRGEAEAIIACGGIKLDLPNNLARLRWDMVRRECQGQGVGTFLTKARLWLLCQIPEVELVCLGTSQHSHKFYEKMGFSTLQVKANGIAPGLDEYTLQMVFDESQRNEIRHNWAPVTELTLLHSG